VAPSNAVVIPCSSGGAFTTMMQAFLQKAQQKVITNKGLASMGYGLAGAIGASVACRNRVVILVEGDGGFAQNLQEIGTLLASGARVKVFIYSNEGYASIRMTQKNYFGGAYMGCDISTGLGLPNWQDMFASYGLTSRVLSLNDLDEPAFLEELESDQSVAYMVSIHPEQTYFPKISSSIGENGQMISDPIHLMTPPLDSSISKEVFRYN
jgi:acetolactate synthase-1/2/3 large subunit